MSDLIIPSRRGFLTGLASTLIAAPAIVRVTSIMPVRSPRPADAIYIYNNCWIRYEILLADRRAWQLHWQSVADELLPRRYAFLMPPPDVRIVAVDLFPPLGKSEGY